MPRRDTDAARIAGLEDQLRMVNLRLTHLPKPDELRVLVRRDVYGRSWWGQAAPLVTVAAGTAGGTATGTLLAHTATPLRVGAAVLIAIFSAWVIKPRVDQLFVSLFERAWQRRKQEGDARMRGPRSPNGPGPNRELPSTLSGQRERSRPPGPETEAD